MMMTMKKWMYVSLVAFAIAVSAASPAWADESGETAESVEAAAEALCEASDGFFTIDAQSGRVYAQPVRSDNDFWTPARDTLGRVFRSVSPSALNDVSGTYTDNDLTRISYYITYDQIDALEEDQEYVDAWVRETVPGIVQDGMSRDDAIKQIYYHIARNYLYDVGAAADPSLLRQSQSACEAIRTGRGVCASLTLLFRAMVEAVPFNGEGVVDWASGAEYIDVAYVRTIDHAWAAIQEPGGQWRYYDLAGAVPGSDGSGGAPEHFYRMSAGDVIKEDPAYRNVDLWTWAY